MTEVLAGKRVLVVGLGTSGEAAARALLGMDAKVRVTDGADDPAVRERAETLRAAGAEVETGGHDLEALDADLAVVSPGIPPSAPVIRALVAGHVPMIGEVELAYRLARCDFLAVTGTNGKTTTTTLLAAMLQSAGIPTLAAGNIGLPLVEAVRRVPQGGAIAVEVSSFQLVTAETFRARVAVLLNVAEDHTDWHGSFADYAEAKARVVMNQDAEDVFVPNASDAYAMRTAARTPARVVPFSATEAQPEGIGPQGHALVWRGLTVVETAAIPLPGVAGLEDTAAAAAAALEYGAPVDAVARAIRSFRPLDHRLTPVGESRGVTYIDDSKATNPHATLTAVRGLRDVVLIAGGRSKGIDLSVLAATVPPVRAVVALGEDAKRVEEVFAPLVDVTRVDTMEAAVAAAARLAVPGGSVLLSPACASLDMYGSYAERGAHFARVVQDLIRKESRGGES